MLGWPSAQGPSSTGITTLETLPPAPVTFLTEHLRQCLGEPQKWLQQHENNAKSVFINHLPRLGVKRSGQEPENDSYYPLTEGKPVLPAQFTDQHCFLAKLQLLSTVNSYDHETASTNQKKWTK